MSAGVFTPSEMSPLRRLVPMPPLARAALARMAIDAGQHVREERRRRGWTLRAVAERAGVAATVVHSVESGTPASLESYARIATALGLRPELLLSAGRARGAPRDDVQDFVHAAMGECEVRALRGPLRTIAIDEPYQHYQFAGRADVLAWTDRDLLHIENRTRFPNIQEAAGAYNAKRRYLAPAMAERLDLGPRGWRTVTHVMACLWSSEVLHVIRLRPATFEAICPDPTTALDAWLQDSPPAPGVTSSLVLLDPAVPFGSRRRTIAGLGDAERVDPRFRGYGDAAEGLRRPAPRG
jgi:transcriptional regulator with XRE-family HTH domain